MLRIALTGPSGAGKGYVGKALIQKGIPVLDTDRVVHTLYAGGELPMKIATLFGDSVLNTDGSVARKQLAKIVFSDRSALESLNRLVHAAVKSETEKWLLQCGQNGNKIAVVDAPQLFEAHMEKDFDFVVAVIANEQTRISRICLRDGIDESLALQRIQNQMSDEEYSKRSHFTLINNTDSDLQGQIDELINNIFQI